MIFEVRIGFAHFCCNGLLVCPLTVKSILSPFKGRMICQVFSVCSFVLLVLFVCLLDYGLDNASDRLGRYLSGDGFVSCSRFSRIVFLQQQRPENSSKQKKTVYGYSIYCSHSTMLAKFATPYAMMAAAAIRRSLIFFKSF